MNYKFEPGRSYVATTPINDAEQIIVCCTSVDSERDGRVVTLSRVSDVDRAPVMTFDDRDTAVFHSRNGLTYFVAASVPVDLPAVTAAMKMIREGQNG